MVHDITKITCHNGIYYHTELRTPLKGLVSRRYRCVKVNSVKTSFILSLLKPLLCTFTYTQNAVVEL